MGSWNHGHHEEGLFANTWNQWKAFHQAQKTMTRRIFSGEHVTLNDSAVPFRIRLEARSMP